MRFSGRASEIIQQDLILTFCTSRPRAVCKVAQRFVRLMRGTWSSELDCVQVFQGFQAFEWASISLGNLVLYVCWLEVEHQRERKQERNRFIERPRCQADGNTWTGVRTTFVLNGTTYSLKILLNFFFIFKFLFLFPSYCWWFSRHVLFTSSVSSLPHANETAFIKSFCTQINAGKVSRRCWWILERAWR